jgi:hypothetical protein
MKQAIRRKRVGATSASGGITAGRWRLGWQSQAQRPLPSGAAAALPDRHNWKLPQSSANRAVDGRARCPAPTVSWSSLRDGLEAPAALRRDRLRSKRDSLHRALS